MSLEILENVIGVNEASEIWGLGVDRIKSLAQDGKIEAKKIGKTWVIEKYQKNPRTYSRKHLTLTHFQHLKLNVKAFENYNFATKPKFQIKEEFDPANSIYSVYVNFSMGILKVDATIENLTASLLLVGHSEEDSIISTEFDNLIQFEDMYLHNHVLDEANSIAVQCRKTFDTKQKKR